MFKLINKQRNKKGFTLIELIVVIAILAVIILIAVPRFSKITEQANVTRAMADGNVIMKASLLYYIDVGEYPQNAINGLGTFEEWQDSSIALFITGEDQGSRWNGPYIEMWPESTPWGGVYAYRRYTTEDIRTH